MLFSGLDSMFAVLGIQDFRVYGFRGLGFRGSGFGGFKVQGSEVLVVRGLGFSFWRF